MINRFSLSAGQPANGSPATDFNPWSVRQQQVKTNADEQGVNQQGPLSSALKLPLGCRCVRQGFGPLLEVGDADRAEHEAERDQHAADNLKRVQMPA